MWWIAVGLLIEVVGLVWTASALGREWKDAGGAEFTFLFGRPKPRPEPTRYADSDIAWVTTTIRDPSRNPRERLRELQDEIRGLRSHVNEVERVLRSADAATDADLVSLREETVVEAKAKGRSGVRSAAVGICIVGAGTLFQLGGTLGLIFTTPS